MARGGRLIYAGAGTAGRIGVLDASECGPTFNTDRVLGVIAGGQVAVSTASESAEDDADAGARALADLALTAADAVVGISASGRTPYVLGAIAYARDVGRADGRARLQRRLRAERGGRAPDRGARRARVHRRLDAPEGRHRPEARAEHALDADDGPAREDLREPDGRRPRDQREAARPRDADRRAGRGRARARRPRRRWTPPARTRRSRSRCCAPASTPSGRAGCSTPPRAPAPGARRMSREVARASDSTTSGCETRRSRAACA